MKKICLVFVLLGLGCKARKGSFLEICDRGNFSQQVAQVSFDDENGLKALNGKFVQIEGIFYDEFENVGLFPKRHSNSNEHSLYVNFVIPDSLLVKFDAKRVSVIGRVNTAGRGHSYGYLATLDSIFCIKVVE